MNDDSTEFQVTRRDSGDFWFTHVDIAVARDPSLSAMEKAVYLALCSHADTRSRSCFPSNRTLANEVGCSERTVQRSLDVLENRGIIKRQERFKEGSQQTNIIWVIGWHAPCYQGKGDDSRDTPPCPPCHQGDDTGDTPLPTPMSPRINENQINENQGTSTPLPPAGGAAAAEPADEIRRKAHERATINVLLNDVCCLWNAALGPLGFPQVSKITPARARAFRARLNDLAARRELAWWRDRIAQLAASEFMRTSAKEKAGWLTLDWLLNENNLVKVTEGRYYNTRRAGPTYDQKGQPVEKFSEPEAREFTQEQEDYLEMAHAGKKFVPEYMAYLEDKYGGGKFWA